MIGILLTIKDIAKDSNAVIIEITGTAIIGLIMSVFIPHTSDRTEIMNA